MKNESEQFREQVGMVRDVEASLQVKHPIENDLKFRSSLLNRCTTELDKLEMALVRRLHAAACGVEFPDDAVLKFRTAIQCVLGKHYNLRAYRAEERKAA